MTQNGYMGLGNPKIGNEIFVLFGSDVPFILRPDPESSRFFLIGDCYVQGIMNGEAMTEVEERKRKIVLR